MTWRHSLSDVSTSVERERDLIVRTEAALGGPITKASLTVDLCALAIPETSAVIVHSSMSSLGWVAGGPVTVIDSLLDAFSGSTIVMPTQSGQCSDPALWSNPPVPVHWVDILRRSTPAFDPARTPTRAMGQVVESFRSMPGTIRGPHPTVSFAACGPLAERIVHPHPLTPQFGEESPLARLFDIDAIVLLLGVDHGNNTSLHLAEHRAQWDGRPKPRADGSMLAIDGEPTWVCFHDEPANDDGFAELGEAFNATGGEHSGSVGLTTARWCRMREIVDFAVPWLQNARAPH
jgi:aminoglycoside 3-N-acetyltransferase